MKKQKTEFVILGLLTVEPLSGYDIKKFIAKSTGHFWSESNGQLYPALNNLLKRQLIRFEQTQRKGKKESHLYSITEEGRAELKNWLENGVVRKSIHRDEELLKLFFGQNTSPATCIELLKTRKKRVRDVLMQLTSVQQEIKKDKGSPHYLYWVLSLKNGIARTEAELKWCQESIQTLNKKGLL